jgi:hypothetical protein
MTTRSPDWYAEHIAQATEWREIYAAAGLQICADVMQEEIDRLRGEYARFLAVRAAALLAERKQEEK